MDEMVNSLDEKFIPMLEKIKEMFLELGVKCLNMDDISRKLGISKKTLYRYVDSKESLIGKLFEYENHRWEIYFNELNKKSLNAIEKLFEVSLRVHLERKNFDPKLVFELKKFYEPIFNEYMLRNRSFIQKRMTLNLEQGISEGLYRTDVNISLTVALYINTLLEMHNNAMFRTNHISFDELFEVMFDHHIRAISTPEGLTFYEKRRKEISTYLNKNNL